MPASSGRARSGASAQHLCARAVPVLWCNARVPHIAPRVPCSAAVIACRAQRPHQRVGRACAHFASVTCSLPAPACVPCARPALPPASQASSWVLLPRAQVLCLWCRACAPLLPQRAVPPPSCGASMPYPLPAHTLALRPAFMSRLPVQPRPRASRCVRCAQHRCARITLCALRAVSVRAHHVWALRPA